MDIQNLDLSGVTGTINYDNAVGAVQPFTELIMGLVTIFLVFSLLWFLVKRANPESQSYRTLLANMYVAGTIKKIAERDGINLKEELKEFASYVKKSGLNMKNLDDVVEGELNEEISENFEKRRKEIKNESKEKK